MTWAECLAVFNFIAWLLPIIVRSYIAWKVPSDSRITLSDSDNSAISKAISRLNLRGKKLIIGDGAKADRDIQKGSK